jgi:DDE family transposase
VILASSLPRFKAFLGDHTPSACGLLLLTAFLLHRGRLCVARAARSIRSEVRDAGNLLRFLAGSREPALLLGLAQQALLRDLLDDEGLWVFAVDSTQHGQQGQHTENTFSRANYHRRPRKSDRKQKKYHRRSCHCFVVGLLLSPQGARIPFWLPYYSRDYCRQRRLAYQTQAQLAARLVRELPLPAGARVVVVGDTAFDAAWVRDACAPRGWWWLTPVNPERVLAGPKPRAKVSSLAKHLTANSFAAVTLRPDQGPHAAQRRASPGRAKDRQGRTYWVHARTEQVHSVGEVLLLFSTGKRPQGAGVPVQKVLMTNATQATAEQVLTWYGLRWQVELLFKELKGELGLTRYKFQRFCKVERWVALCLVAFCYLEWYRRARERESRGKPRTRWRAARTHGLREALQLEVEEEDLRQIGRWLEEGRGLDRLRQVLRAGYDPRGPGVEEGDTAMAISKTP